jgi:hypothetical protein
MMGYPEKVPHSRQVAPTRVRRCVLVSPGQELPRRFSIVSIPGIIIPSFDPLLIKRFSMNARIEV